MKKQKQWAALWACCVFLILIFDSKAVLRGAMSGIDICIRSVVPSLFPFLVISISLSDALSGIESRVLEHAGKLFGLRKGSESILISSFLGGYPAGAQSIASAFQNGYIAFFDARRYLTFCNNAGPAFIFGMLSPLFSEKSLPWKLWGIHILSALIIAQFSKSEEPSPNMSSGQAMQKKDTMQTAVKTMAVVCGWIIFFRVILVFAFRWFLWFFPPVIQICIAGILELSNGCLLLSEITNESLRFVIASAMLSFGGLCIIMQTKSVAGALCSRQYIFAKLLQTILSVFLSSGLVLLGHSFLILVLGIILLAVLRIRKNSSIPDHSVV